MAQETGFSWVDVDLDVAQADSFASPYVVSGAMVSISVGGGGRQSAEEYTADGDDAILFFGKRQPLEITIRAIYQQTVDKLSDLMRQSYDAAGGGVFAARWYPRGKVDTRWMYSTAGGKIISPSFPGNIESSIADGAPIVVEGVLRCISITKATYNA